MGSHFSLSPPPPMANPVVVIGSHFSLSHPVKLELKKIKHGFHVHDVFDDSILFQIKDAESAFHDRRILLDSYGNIIVNLKQKIWTQRRRWQVYRGASKDEQDLLFAVIKPDEQQTLKPKLHVFLASNTNEAVPDFRIEGSWSAGSFAIYVGESSTIVAILPPDSSAVTVDAHIDYAFIATLIVVLYEILQGEDSSAPALLDAFGTILFGF